MFDLGADEILLTAIVAVVAIGPKELPRAMRLAGRWIGKFRRYSTAFRTGIDTMIREAETDDLEQQWSSGRDEVLAQFAEQERLGKEAETDRLPTGPARERVATKTRARAARPAIREQSTPHLPRIRRRPSDRA